MESSRTKEPTLAERVAQLLPRIRERVGEAEKARSIPSDTIRDLAATGLFRAYVPRAFGGEESRIAPIHDALIELGTACTSSAWVASLFVSHAIMVRWLDERAQRDVWRDGPDALISSSVAAAGTAVPSGDGYVLNGRWSFSSGIDHAQWILLVATISDGQSTPEPAKRICLVPASQISVEDDWHVAGLRATGSKSVIVRDVFVPHYRTEDMVAVRAGLSRGRTSNPSHLTRLPWKQFLDYSFCPAALGATLAAIEFFREHISRRTSAMTGQQFRTRASSWDRLAQATADADAALLIHRRDIGELDGFDEMPEKLRRLSASRREYGPSRVVELCRRAVGRLFRGSGGGALYEKSPMQRYFRDLNAITQHTAHDIDIAGERYGNALLEAAPGSLRMLMDRDRSSEAFRGEPDANVLWRILTSKHWLSAVSAADECGIFVSLQAQPASAEVLAERSGLDVRALRSVLTMLAALGLLVPRASEFHLHATAARYLVPDTELYWGPVLRAEARTDPAHGLLVGRLKGRSGSALEQRRQPFENWDHGAVAPELAARIARFMHALSVSEAPFVAKHPSLEGIGRVLDVGGGAGSLSIAIAQARPDVTCTVMDLPGMCAQAAELIRAAGMEYRVGTHGCDMFRQAWPRDHDAVLMSNVLHDWSEEECAQLVSRAYEALPRSGRIYLHEALLHEDSAGPIVPAGLSVRMLLDTRGQQFTLPALRKLLERAGFQAVERHDVSGLYSLVTARKAA